MSDQQLAFADAFGVIPSVQSAAEAYAEDMPDLPAVRQRRRVRPEPARPGGAADVIGDFNAQLRDCKDGDAAAILESVQGSLQAVVGQ